MTREIHIERHRDEGLSRNTIEYTLSYKKLKKVKRIIYSNFEKFFIEIKCRRRRKKWNLVLINYQVKMLVRLQSKNKPQSHTREIRYSRFLILFRPINKEGN